MFALPSKMKETFRKAKKPQNLTQLVATAGCISSLLQTYFAQVPAPLHFCHSLCQRRTNEKEE
jgi:hypothetical protein